MNAWYFRENLPTKTLFAVEPDGTEHIVENGNMNSLAGFNLLNRMIACLTEKCDKKCDNLPPP